MLVVSRQPCFHNAACWPFVSSCTAPDWDSPFRVLENSSAAISSHLVRHDHIVLSTSLHGQRFRQLDFDRLLLPLHSNYRVGLGRCEETRTAEVCSSSAHAHFLHLIELPMAIDFCARSSARIQRCSENDAWMPLASIDPKVSPIPSCNSAAFGVLACLARTLRNLPNRLGDAP